MYLRVATAIAIYFWADSFLAHENYRAIFVQPRFLFKYNGLEWITRWPGDGFYWHFVLTKCAAVCLATGFLTRISAAIACTSIAYVLLVERAIYVNHYYLLSCAAGWLTLLPSGQRLSIDRRLGIARRADTIPFWQLATIRFQLGLPYVFGAFAKLNGDWMQGQPGESILRLNMWIPGDFTATRVYTWTDLSEPFQQVLLGLFVYGGFAYDLLIVPMLLIRRTRTLAVILSVIFHLTNAMWLNIGVFPWFMLATVVLFFPHDTLYRLANRIVSTLKHRWCFRQLKTTHKVDDTTTTTKARGSAGTTSPHRLTSSPRPTTEAALRAFTVFYVAIQLLLPLRPGFYPGDANWNEKGHRYAWRMMLRHKEALLHFKVVDNQTDEHLFLPSTTVVTAYQSVRADYHPELILQTARQLALAAREFGVADCSIYACALVSLNGRKPKLIIDPSVDLLTVTNELPDSEWMFPDPGELEPSELQARHWGSKPWTEPLETWWKKTALPQEFQPLQNTTPADLLRRLQTVSKR